MLGKGRELVIRDDFFVVIVVFELELSETLGLVCWEVLSELF